MLLAPPQADAYRHVWNCNGGIGPNVRCADYTGQIFNGWFVITAGFGNPLPSGYNGMCTKAITAAGNIKNGSNCAGSSTTILSISIAVAPSSQAYYYFGGSGISRDNNGLADTP